MASKRRKNPSVGTMPTGNLTACTIEMPSGRVEFFDTVGGTALVSSSKPFMRDLVVSLTRVLENMYWEMDLDVSLSLEFTFGSSVSVKIDNSVPSMISIEMTLPKNITSWTQEMANALGEKVYQVFTEDPMYDYEMDEFDIIFELS